jgi:hypothetical protein
MFIFLLFFPLAGAGRFIPVSSRWEFYVLGWLAAEWLRHCHSSWYWRVRWLMDHVDTLELKGQFNTEVRLEMLTYNAYCGHSTGRALSIRVCFSDMFSST